MGFSDVLQKVIGGVGTAGKAVGKAGKFGGQQVAGIISGGQAPVGNTEIVNLADNSGRAALVQGGAGKPPPNLLTAAGQGVTESTFKGPGVGAKISHFFTQPGVAGMLADVGAAISGGQPTSWQHRLGLMVGASETATSRVF